MNPSAEARVRRELASREQLLWCGRPGGSLPCALVALLALLVLWVARRWPRFVRIGRAVGAVRHERE